MNELQAWVVNLGFDPTKYLILRSWRSSLTVWFQLSAAVCGRLVVIYGNPRGSTAGVNLLILLIKPPSEDYNDLMDMVTVLLQGYICETTYCDRRLR